MGALTSALSSFLMVATADSLSMKELVTRTSFSRKELLHLLSSIGLLLVGISILPCWRMLWLRLKPCVLELRSLASTLPVGVMGSSAGGHLTAHTVTSYGEYSKDLRPAFGVLCYPVVEMDGVFTHQGSRKNLLGENPSKELRRSVSPKLKVTAETPPCFIWHTVEDPVVPVENSLLFASVLQVKGVPFELHVYPKGRHGLGMNSGFGWEESLIRWIDELFE